MENIREIVNGKLLQQFVGKKVSITGFVNKTEPNGMSLELKAVDNEVVKVLMKKPIQGVVEGYIQVLGTSQGKSVTCEEYIQFKEDQENPFDAEAHNTMCRLFHSLPNYWDIDYEQGNESNAEDNGGMY